jgi:hypothetical protein
MQAPFQIAFEAGDDREVYFHRNSVAAGSLHGLFAGERVAVMKGSRQPSSGYCESTTSID